MSAQQQTIQFIPLNKLVASSRNVRRKHPKTDIESLAESIASRGLLQNLCVVAGEKDSFEVEAGGRRRLALKLLAKQGRIAKDWPVPCHIVAREDGLEVSLTENVHRVSMDAMDEVDAYAGLVAEGKTPDEVARRFGVERRHVDQRLALAGLSPRIKAAWKRGDISLEAARAFCLVEDHAQQNAVFKSLGRSSANPASVRARLMDGRVRASDRLAVYVGLELYTEAGGKLLRDLFDDEAVFVEDPALLAKLAEDKAGALAAQRLVDGWSWAEVNLSGGRNEGLSTTRLHAGWRDPTADEQAELDRLTAEIEKLDAELEASFDDDDPRWSIRDDLEAAFETIRQTTRCWSADAKALAGVMLTVDYEGDLVVTEGLVKNEDQKRAQAYLRQQRGEDIETEEGEVSAELEREKHVSAFPKSVNRDLTLARTRAIRLRLSAEPDVALAVCVAAMVHRVVNRSDMTGIALSAYMRTVDDLPALEEARSEIEGHVAPEETKLLEWALDLSRDRLLAVLAIVVAGAIDLAHDDASHADRCKQGVADRLAQQLDIDMRQFWRPDLAFWVRLSKTTLMNALAESPGMDTLNVRTREDRLKAHAKLRKDDLAAKVSVAFEGAEYLPDILVTPVLVGSFEVTPEGAAAAAGAVAVAAE